MKPPLFCLIVCTGIWVSSDVIIAADKIEISSIITKSDAETILEEPVKDMSRHGGEDEFKSHCTYYTVASKKWIGVVAGNSLNGTIQPYGGGVVNTTQPSKALALEVSKTAPGRMSAEMRFSSRTNYSTKRLIGGLAGKAAFVFEKGGGRPSGTLCILRGDAVVVISIMGIEDENLTLEKSKTVALKVLERL